MSLQQGQRIKGGSATKGVVKHDQNRNVPSGMDRGKTNATLITIRGWKEKTVDWGGSFTVWVPGR